MLEKKEWGSGLYPTLTILYTYNTIMGRPGVFRCVYEKVSRKKRRCYSEVAEVIL